jgi:hypothetical protein
MAKKEDAQKAIQEPNPIIDGRKANVNLAYIGAKPRLMQSKLPSKNLVLTIFSSAWRSGWFVPKCGSQSSEPDDNSAWHVLDHAAATGRLTPERWVIYNYKLPLDCYQTIF